MRYVERRGLQEVAAGMARALEETHRPWTRALGSSLRRLRALRPRCSSAAGSGGRAAARACRRRACVEGSARYIPHPVHAETPLTICCHIPQPSYFESSGKQASTSMLGSCRPGLQKQKRPPLPDAATLPAEMPSKCWGSGFALGL